MPYVLSPRALVSRPDNMDANVLHTHFSKASVVAYPQLSPIIHLIFSTVVYLINGKAIENFHFCSVYMYKTYLETIGYT